MTETQDYYDSITEGYDELHGEEQRRKMKIIHSMLKERGIRPKLVLDIGCGTGISMEGFENCIGIDPSIGLLRKAQNLKNKGTKIVVNGFGQNLQFKNGLFDLVISVTALHHMEPIEKTLREIKRVGKKWVVLSILRQTAKRILPIIKKELKVVEKREERHDVILLCAIRKED